jgi:AcrR family transcriptional regulator
VRDKQREETRRRVYRSALEIFRRDTVAGCRIDDIAQKAEVSRGAFYFHFATKDDVLIELLREGEQPVAEAINALPADVSLMTVLEAVNEACAKFWENERTLLPDVATVALRLYAVTDARDAEPVRTALAERFRLAATRQELSPVLPPEVLSDFFLANSLSAMLAWCANPALGLPFVLNGVTHLFLEGARGRGLNGKS